MAFLLDNQEGSSPEVPSSATEELGNCRGRPVDSALPHTAF